MKEFLLILTGAISSALGGCIAIWYQTKKARQIRMEEVRGEQQLEACKKALSLIDQIQTLLIQRTSEDVIKFLYDNGEWLSMNQILLPPTLVDNWRSIRLNIQNMQILEQAVREKPIGAERSKVINEAVEIGEYVRKLAKEAEDILRKELKLPEVKIKTPEKQ